MMIKGHTFQETKIRWSWQEYQRRTIQQPTHRWQANEPVKNLELNHHPGRRNQESRTIHYHNFSMKKKWCFLIWNLNSNHRQKMESSSKNLNNFHLRSILMRKLWKINRSSGISSQAGANVETRLVLKGGIGNRNLEEKAKKKKEELPNLENAERLIDRGASVRQGIENPRPQDPKWALRN